MKIVISGHFGGDATVKILDTDTGLITTIPGNRHDDVKHALHILKHGAETNDVELRKAAIKTAIDFFDSKDIAEIFGPSCNIAAVF